MKKNNKELREIPTKNYYIVFIVSILVVIFALYVRSFYLNYQSYKTEDGIFHDKSINQIKMEDLDYALVEATDVVLFVSYNGDKKITNMERRLYREIERKDLNDKIMYLDVSNYLDNNKYSSILRKKFSNIEIDINRAPMFIYIKDGVAIEAIDSKEELVDYKVLNGLLIKYGIE